MSLIEQLTVYIMKIELMHSVGDCEGLLPECSVSYLELRQLKLKHTWHLTPCLLQIINGWLHTGQYKFRWITIVVEVASGKGHALMALINIRNSTHVVTLVWSLVYAYFATLTVAALAVGIRMRYLAISGEDLSTYLLVHDKSCFVQWWISKLVCCSPRLAPRW